MEGIDLNRPVIFLHSSMRYFRENEHHINRTSVDEVLVMVYEGILRFSEDGVEYEIHPGHYHIQKKNSVQRGNIASDSPRYLYVHFLADWSGNGEILKKSGEFDIQTFMPLMVKLDEMSHSDYTVTERATKFLELISMLYRGNANQTLAGQIADYISGRCISGITLEKLAEEFHFSKNHVINIFKKEYNMTPFEYVNELRVKKSEWLLEASNKSAQEIAIDCGFNNYSNFYKIFRQINGLSPTEWRERKRLKPADIIKNK